VPSRRVMSDFDVGRWTLSVGRLLLFSLLLIETHSLPALARCYPHSFYVDHSHCLVLAPATLAALPSTRAIPYRNMFYVAHPIHSILNSSAPDQLCFQSAQSVSIVSSDPY
jgi:hypothetical protein